MSSQSRSSVSAPASAPAQETVSQQDIGSNSDAQAMMGLHPGGGKKGGGTKKNTAPPKDPTVPANKDEETPVGNPDELLGWAANLEKTKALASTPDATWKEKIKASPVSQVQDFINSSAFYGRCLAIKGTAILEAFQEMQLPIDQFLTAMAGTGLSDSTIPHATTALDASPAILNYLTTKLPKGSALSASQRAGMARLVIKGNPAIATAMTLFSHRFTTRIENTTGTWTLANLRSMWQQLDVLPDSDVSDNTVLEVIRATSGGGGMAGGDYIEIGESQGLPRVLQHTVRHEIGHTVHDGPLKASVDRWLHQGVKMWYFSADSTGIRQFILDLGGWPSQYTDASGQSKTFGSDDQVKIVDMLLSYIGPGQRWGPARDKVADAAVTDSEQLWAAMPEAIRNAVGQSTENWYSNNANFQSGPKGKYFFNYWYRTPYYMSTTAQAIVNQTESYTAMSHYEFFANSYAEYFKDPAGYADHSKWGGSLDASTRAFFESTVVNHQPYSPPADNTAGTGTGTQQQQQPAPAAGGGGGGIAHP